MAEICTWQISFKILADPYLAAGFWIYSSSILIAWYVHMYIQVDQFFQRFSIRSPLSSAGSIPAEIVLFFAESNLLDFYISTFPLFYYLLPSKFLFFRVFPANFQLLKEDSGFCVIDSHRDLNFAFCFCLEFLFYNPSYF